MSTFSQILAATLVPSVLIGDDSFRPNYTHRSEVPLEESWNLEEVFADLETWENEFAAIKAALPSLGKLKDSLNSSTDLLIALDYLNDLSTRIERVSVYASLFLDQDTSSSIASAMLSRDTTLWAEYQVATSFLEPSLVALGQARIEEMILEHPALSTYKAYFEDIFRRQEYILSPEMESVLSAALKSEYPPRSGWFAECCSLKGSVN
jgi:oligoendopeptidase F